ncbi:DNA primase [Myxococcota bacterium]|nr:DNA primase [Myxococcota bacterium]
MIPRELIDTIRDRVDIAEVVGQTVSLQRKGSTLLGLCPFHNEKTPSFNVVPAKGIYHCFGCGAGGDVFQFLMQTQGMSFHEAVRDLGARVGVAVEERQLSPDERARMKARTDLYEICDLAAQHFEAVLRTRPEGEPARAYLRKRGMKEETWQRYRLGYAPPTWSDLVDHLARQGVSPELAVAAGVAKARDGREGAYDLFRGRVIIPIQDERGRIVAFGGRHLEEMPGGPRGDAPPKYVNSPETQIYSKSKTLYALSHARPAIQRRGRAIVVEGYFDVLSLHQAGFTEAIATCGTALTEEHLRVLRPLTTSVVALFDSDEAGVRAALKSLELFYAAGIEPRRLDLGGAKDPDDFVQARGAEAFEARLRQSEPLFDIALRIWRGRHGSSPDGKRQVLAELAPVVRRVDPATRAALVERLGRALDMRDDVVNEVIGLTRAAAAPAELAEPVAFRGSKELNHLLWLLIHHHARVAPLVAGVDPGLLTSRLDVARVIARLLSGEGLPAVLDQVEDPDLARVLRACAVRHRQVRDGKAEELYTEDQAAQATQQMLARLQLRLLDDRIAQVQGDLETCSFADDGSRYREVLVNKQDLVRQRQELLRVVTRKPPP